MRSVALFAFVWPNGQLSEIVIGSGTKLLGERYELFEQLPATDREGESWLALGDFDESFLVRLWRYEGARPDDVKRALWDAELRTLYRIGSSPGADEMLVVLRDAGVDSVAKCFAMILEAPGLDSLAHAIQHRRETPWLAGPAPSERAAIWSALERLADGLRLLHDQQVLHRNVGVESVYLDRAQGPESMRLGGFEWSIRLGVPADASPPADWSTPPEMLRGERYGYRMETDWYAFGILLVRCLLNVEAFGRLDALDRHAKTVDTIKRSGGRLTDLERDLLLRLVSSDPRDRLSRGADVGGRIRDIVTALELGQRAIDVDSALILVVDTRNPGDLLRDAEAKGFALDSKDPNASYNPTDPVHTAGLTKFLTEEFREAQVHAVGDEPRYLLVGRLMTVRVVPLERFDRGTRTRVRDWTAAYCAGPAYLRAPEGASASLDVPKGALAVRSRETTFSVSSVLETARNWEPLLPRIDRAARARTGLLRFHHLIRALNQVEVLMRDAELFAYEIVERPETPDNSDRIVIVETDRERPPADFCRIDGGMVEFLQREIEAGAKGAGLVILSSPQEDGLSLDWVPESEQWRVMSIDAPTGRVTLQRVAGALRDPDEIGVLRSHGMFGQVSLIGRRKRSIERLQNHSYLLRSLAAPGQVFMDTGPRAPVFPLDPSKVDPPKREAIRDILRIRPIFALQGPPGTGKTTLVAWLIREILAEDPVAQILVTAQAHGAVDVLREKVRADAYGDTPEEDQPLAVRLGAVQGLAEDGLLETAPARVDKFSVDGVAHGVLQRAVDSLSQETQLTLLQEEWSRAASAMASEFWTGGSGAGAPDFRELVKRGAHLTYCTTSAGQLEALADMTQSFDWSILEEAGKAHTFDLALPLQAGHRWLLIGDQYQLPPYRFHDYSKAIENLAAIVGALDALPPRSGSLVDREWIRWWGALDDDAQARFNEYVRSWLNAFETVFVECNAAVSTRLDPGDDSPRRAARMITGQHRMHPDIGELISQTYYRGELTNETLEDGRPVRRVVHPFAAPPDIAGRAVVWLDVPSCRAGGSPEQGGRGESPRYTNPQEVAALSNFLASLRREAGDAVSLAILSPYNRQVALINERVRPALPDGVALKQALRRRRANEPEVRMAHSVDSFQGNQASVIAVSLVRNNDLPAEKGLGFLIEKPRMNVLLSRAEQLLVLVGSFEFFEYQSSLVDLEDRAHPVWHWKRVVTTLAQWFEEGRAVRLPAQLEARP